MRRWMVVLSLAVATTACGGGGSGSDAAGGADGGGGGDGGGGVTPTLPSLDGVTWAAAVDNPLYPLPAGATWTYEAETPEGLEHIEIRVLPDPRTIQGVSAVAVQDTVTVDGEIAEDTTDWYAQDTAGNVWYLGEDTCEFEGGVCVRHTGTWEWGVAGALPGIIMRAAPAVDGQPYYQEYLEGEAEDAGEVIAVDVAVTIGAGSFTGCVTTHDTSTADLTLDERKTYCPGIGNVRVEEPTATVELTASSLL